MEQRIAAPQLIRESGEAYRARRNQFTTSHALGDFRRCPLLHRQKAAGLIAETIGEHYAIGAAAHCLILEGRAAFESQYIVGGPINDKTGRPYGDETKAFRTWAEQQTKRVISDDAYALCCHLNAAVHAHPVAAKLLARGTPEAVVRASYAGVECQIRMDWFDEAAGIVDLKTCQDIDRFASAGSLYTDGFDDRDEYIGPLAPDCDCARYGYLHQLAFYRAVLNRAAGLAANHPRWPCHLIAVEKAEPYRCGVYRLDDRRLASAERDNEDALKRLAECRRSGLWPTGFERVRYL